MRRKAHIRRRTRGNTFALPVCIFVITLLAVMIRALGSMARNGLPPETPEWEQRLVFWVVGLSPIVGVFAAAMISGALHARRESFRVGNRVEIYEGSHEGCLGIVRGKRTELKKIHLWDEHYLTKEIVHISVDFEKDGAVLTEEFLEDELVKVDFRSRWF